MGVICPLPQELYSILTPVCLTHFVKLQTLNFPMCMNKSEWWSLWTSVFSSTELECEILNSSCSWAIVLLCDGFNMDLPPELRDRTAGLEGTSRSLFRVDCKLNNSEKGLSKRCYQDATEWAPELLCAALHHSGKQAPQAWWGQHCTVRVFFFFLAAGTGTLAKVEGTLTGVRRYTKGTWSRVLMSSDWAEGPSCLKVAQPHNTDVPEGNSFNVLE